MLCDLDMAGRGPQVRVCTHHPVFEISEPADVLHLLNNQINYCTLRVDLYRGHGKAT